MDVVMVELPAVESPARDGTHRGRRAARVLRLRPGDVAIFGRGTPGRPVDIVIPDAGVSRVAGRVEAVDDYWLITNLSRDKTYVVENPEGAGEHVKVPPGRLAAPVPFEFSRVVLPLAGGFASFKVYAPQHAFADGSAWRGEGDLTAGAFSLDETSKYFLVLVALCEPRLRDISTVALPTVDNVLRRLRQREDCAALSRSAINHHLEYLATAKLRLKAPHGSDDSERLNWKREALASVALRFNLVREEHLGLLPARRGRVA